MFAIMAYGLDFLLFWIETGNQEAVFRHYHGTLNGENIRWLGLILINKIRRRFELTRNVLKFEAMIRSQDPRCVDSVLQSKASCESAATLSVWLATYSAVAVADFRVYVTSSYSFVVLRVFS